MSNKKGFDIKEGTLTKKANAAGMTVNAFARKHKNDSGVTGAQSRLYLNVFKPAINKRKKNLN
jgi:hypothetical protein